VFYIFPAILTNFGFSLNIFIIKIKEILPVGAELKYSDRRTGHQSISSQSGRLLCY